jgi:hypothetical protein
MKQASLIIAFAFAAWSGFAQTEKPAALSADFVQGSILTSSYEKFDGFIKESLKKDGSIIFVNAQGQKKTYNVSNLQSFTINNVSYISYLNDFYKTIAAGNKVALYQKVTDNNGKLISNGTESVVATTTDGKVGDYYLQSKKDNDLTLVTRKNFEESVSQVCADCSVLISDVKSKQIDYTQIVKVVEKYNNCIN